MRFQGKVALITGGGSGIGRGAALRFAEEGAHVVVADIVGETAEETASLIQVKTQQQALAVQVDVAHSESVASLVNAAIDRFGQIDILFNSAGILILGSVTELSESDWDHQIDVNLKGIFLCGKYVIPHMIRNGGGCIVNAASIAGVVAFPRNAAYSPSKGGVMLLTKNMALDYVQHNIRVNCVCPYCIEGPLMDRFFAEQADPDTARREIEEACPMGRMGTISEVVEPVLFLASDAASYITGVSLLIDGLLTGGVGGVKLSRMYATKRGER